MKNYFLLVAIMYAFTVHAQKSISDITMPTSPAASVLGLQANNILAPKTFRALETSLYSNFVDDNNSAVIPNDFALEFTPYWAKDHGLSLTDYLFPKSIGDQIWRNSSFSLASTQNLILGDSSHANGLGIGYRTSIYFSSEEDKTSITNYWKQLSDAQSLMAKIGAAVEGEVANNRISSKTEFIKFIRADLPRKIEEVYPAMDNEQVQVVMNKIVTDVESTRKPEFTKDNPDPFLDHFYNLLGPLLHGEEIFTQFEDYIKDRNGFSIDFAAACLVSFPTNDFEFSYAPRQSIWVTPTYRFRNKLEFLKAMIVLRKDWYDLPYYQKYYQGTAYYKSNTDYGVGISGEFKKFSLQIEAVGRNSYTEIIAGQDSEGNDLYRKEQQSAFQYIGTFCYRLTDQVSLNYSLGNKFNLGTTGNSLVSILSINLGFGEPYIIR